MKTTLRAESVKAADEIIVYVRECLHDEQDIQAYEIAAMIDSCRDYEERRRAKAKAKG